MFKTKKVLFDTSVWIGVSGQDLQKLKDYQSRLVKTTEYRFFDSAVNLFETVYTLKERKKEPNRVPVILTKVKGIASDKMLPSTETVVKIAIDKYFERPSYNDLKREKEGYLRMRESLISNTNWINSEEFEQKFLRHYRNVINGYRFSIKQLQNEFLRVVCSEQEELFLNNLFDSECGKNSIFDSFKEKFEIRDTDCLELALGCNWIKIEPLKCFFIWYKALAGRYLVDNRDPFADSNYGDFVDLEFSYHIPCVDIFVSNNTKDLKRVKEQCKKMGELDINDKLKTLNEFMAEIN